MVAVFPIIGSSDDLNILIFGAFLLGVGLLILDSSMNTQAVLLELSIRRPTIGHFHAVYAIGGLSGALLGGVFFEVGLSLLLEFSVFSLAIFLLLGRSLYTQAEEQAINDQSDSDNKSLVSTLSRHFSSLVLSPPTPSLSPKPSRLADATDQPHGRAASSPIGLSLSEMNTPQMTPRTPATSTPRPAPSPTTNPLHRPLLQDRPTTPPPPPPSSQEKEEIGERDLYSLSLICALGFVGYFGEGSVGDWSALFLATRWDCPPLQAALGYVFFQLAVAIGRFYSDRLVLSLGRSRLLVGSGLVAGLGLLVAVAASFAPPSSSSLAGAGRSWASLSAAWA